MDTGSPTLLFVLGPLLGGWACLSVFVLGTRVLHDHRRRAVETAAELIPDSGHRDPPRLFRRKDAGTHLFAADAAAPVTPEVVRAARAAVANDRDHLLGRATTHRGERGRWGRVAALRVLARAGDPETLPLLERALGEGDRELAGAAIDIIGSLGSRSADELLVRTLQAGTYPRSRIASHLDRPSVPIDDLLLPLLDDVCPGVRFWAATLLSGYGHMTGVGIALAGCAADPDPNVRAAIAESLGTSGPSPARDAAVRSLLGDPVWYVRVHAARSVGSLALTSEAKSLTDLLADQEWWVRSAARDGLQALGPTAYPALVVALDHPDRFARNGAAEVLQNTGYIDVLVARVLDPVHPPRHEDLELLRRVFEAGGPALRESVLTMLPGARERLDQLLWGTSAITEAA